MQKIELKKTNNDLFNTLNLNYIEKVLKTLKSNDSYTSLKFPVDGKLTKEWF